MRWYFWALGLSLWISALPATNVLPDTMWQRAIRLLDQGAVGEAVHLLDSLERQGWWSAELYYNLGTAYLMQDDIGRAVLYLRRAQLWAPWDKRIVHNLNVARQRVAYEHPPLSPFFLLRWWQAWANCFSSDVWAVWCILWAWGSVVFGWLWFRKRHRWWARLAVFALFLVAISIALGVTRASLERNHPQVVVLQETTARKGASEDAPPVSTLASGVELQRIDRISDWLKVVLPDGREGWVWVGDVEFVSVLDLHHLE